MNPKFAYPLLLVLAIVAIAFALFTMQPAPEGVAPSGDTSGSAVPSAIQRVKVYFSNAALDPEASCDAVFPVEREIEDTPAVARAALAELLRGPLEEEVKEGYATNINPGVAIRSISIADGVLKVDLDEAIEKEVGGACRVIAIRRQIEATLLQFPTVRSVMISVEGRTADALQP